MSSLSAWMSRESRCDFYLSSRLVHPCPPGSVATHRCCHRRASAGPTTWPRRARADAGGGWSCVASGRPRLISSWAWLAGTVPGSVRPFPSEIGESLHLINLSAVVRSSENVRFNDSHTHLIFVILVSISNCCSFQPRRQEEIYKTIIQSTSSSLPFFFFLRIIVLQSHSIFSAKASQFFSGAGCFLLARLRLLHILQPLAIMDLLYSQHARNSTRSPNNGMAKNILFFFYFHFDSRGTNKITSIL